MLKQSIRSISSKNMKRFCVGQCDNTNSWSGSNASFKIEAALEKIVSRSVSRVLYGRAFARRGSHSSGTDVATRLVQPTRTADPETDCRPLRASAPSLFGFAPDGVYRAVCIAADAVGSYPTLSPLPRHPCRFVAQRYGRRGGLLSVALSLGSPPPGVTRHRVSMEPGLSSPAAFRHMTSAAARPTDSAHIATIAEQWNRITEKICSHRKHKSRQCLQCRLFVHIRRPVLYATADVNLHSHPENASERAHIGLDRAAIFRRGRVHTLCAVTGIVLQDRAASAAAAELLRLGQILHAELDVRGRLIETLG